MTGEELNEFEESEDDDDAMEDAVAIPTVDEPDSKRQRIQLIEASLSNIQEQLLKIGRGNVQERKLLKNGRKSGQIVGQRAGQRRHARRAELKVAQGMDAGGRGLLASKDD